MNWTLAIPEIVLACVGMGTMVFGVLRKQDSTLLCTMFVNFGFLITGLLVAFFCVHVLQVIRAGWNALRAMLVGWEAKP